MLGRPGSPGDDGKKSWRSRQKSWRYRAEVTRSSEGARAEVLEIQAEVLEVLGKSYKKSRRCTGRSYMS